MSAKERSIPKRNLIGSLALAIAVVEPLMTLPQIYQIWSTQNAGGVSLITWSGYIGAACIWLMYSLKIKDTPLMITSILWVITEGMVVAGTVLY